MINELRLLELHDTPIKLLQVDFEKEELLFIVSRYDENLGDYSDIELKFFEVSNLSLDPITDVSILEIFNVVINIIDSELYKIEFILIYHYSTVNINFNFQFKNVEVLHRTGEPYHNCKQ